MSSFQFSVVRGTPETLTWHGALTLPTTIRTTIDLPVRVLTKICMVEELECN